jgi:hypothetical protein
MQLVSVPDPLLTPTWLTAVFTGVLAVFAIVTAIFAFLAFRKQSAELAILKGQADDQQAANAKLAAAAELQAQELRESLDDRERLAEERRRAQAEQVFMWTDRPGMMPARIPAGVPHEVAVHVRNASPQPIRGVMFSWYRGHSSWDAPETVPYLMPGDEHMATRTLPGDLPGNADLRIFGATVMFRDRARVLWRIRRDGSVAEVLPDEAPDAMFDE